MYIKKSFCSRSSLNQINFTKYLKQQIRDYTMKCMNLHLTSIRVCNQSLLSFCSKVTPLSLDEIWYVTCLKEEGRI